MKLKNISIALLAAGLLVGCNNGELTVGDTANNGQQNNGANNGEVFVPEPGEVDPSRVTLHRLNRAEFNNTMRDLLSDTTSPAETFPEDDFGYGFNNIADVLSISPLHIESYHLAIEQIVDRAMDQGGLEPEITRFEAETVTGSVGSASGDYWNLFSNGEITTVHTFPVAGDYKFTVRAYQSAAGPDDAAMSVTLNGTALETFAVSNVSGNAGIFEVTATVPAGGQALAVTFENDFYDPAIPADRNLYVDWFEVEGPLNAYGEASPVRDEILVCDPSDSTADACAGEILSAFGERAWRRPMEDEEVTRLTQFVTLALGEGDDFETGIRLAMRAILMSPNFIYRVELDPDPDSSEPHALTDYELASRLSYFLWSSMPDQELFDLAEAGTLNDETVLVEQVQRMLDDPKSDALIDNFATQWLYIDQVLVSDPDYELFPDFDEELKVAMRAETRMFFRELVDSNAPLSSLVNADFTFLNARLAQHYGVTVPGATDELARHQWQDDSRRGLIGHGSLLVATSHRARTSPVKRGDWVLANLLCDEPPAAPPEVEGFPENPEELGEMTMRERLAAHAINPTCAACHYQMDPIGLGMENYDATGAWRDMDNGLPIDPAGELPGDLLFSGPTELSAVLGAHERLPLCTMEKLASYGIGRGIEYYDRTLMEQLVATTEPNGHRFRDMISAIVLSDAFRMRRGGKLGAIE